MHVSNIDAAPGPHCLSQRSMFRQVFQEASSATLLRVYDLDYQEKIGFRSVSDGEVEGEQYLDMQQTSIRRASRPALAVQPVPEVSPRKVLTQQHAVLWGLQTGPCSITYELSLLQAGCDTEANRQVTY